MNANLSHDPYRTSALEKPTPITKGEIMRQMARKPYFIAIIVMGVICLSAIGYGILTVISLVFFSFQA